jgi:hypothetical protein
MGNETAETMQELLDALDQELPKFLSSPPIPSIPVHPSGSGISITPLAKKLRKNK